MGWGNCLDSAGVATLGCVSVVFQNIIAAALGFAGIAAVFLIVHAGFKFVIANGDPQKIQAARNTALWALFGLIIILFSFLVLNIISYITGVNCILNFGFLSC